MVYPALLPLMRTPRLPVVDWTDAPCRFKRTRPFRRKTKSGFCACAITFQLASKAIHSITWKQNVHSVTLTIQSTQTRHKKSILFYVLLHVSARILTIVSWKSTEGKSYRRDIAFKIHLPKYITYYSPQTNNKQEQLPLTDWHKVIMSPKFIAIMSTDRHLPPHDTNESSQHHRIALLYGPF